MKYIRFILLLPVMLIGFPLALLAGLYNHFFGKDFSAKRLRENIEDIILIRDSDKLIGTIDEIKLIERISEFKS